MKTAARAMILASLVGTACSGETGENPMPAGPGTDVTAPTSPTDGMSAGPGVNPTNGPGTTAGPNGPTTGSPTGGTTPTSPTGGPSEVEMPATGKCQLGVPVTSQIPRLTNLQYDRVVKDVLKVNPTSGSSWSATFEPDSRGELPSTQWAQYQSSANKIAAAVMSTPLGAELTTAAGDGAALESSIRELGRKMFRRPLEDSEVAQFLKLADVQPQGTPAEIAEAVVYTMLISPSFLTRAELDAPEEMVPGTENAPQTAYKLSSHEVASRLSFLIWNSVPDAALDAAADAGELQTKEQIQAQAQRMLGEEFRDKVAPVIAQAHRFWANIDETSSTSRWGKTPHDKARFPEYSEAQNPALMAEVDNFFADVAYGGKFEDLFLSNVAYVNQDTAPLYGLTGNFGPELQRVELDSVERPGFLTRGAFLSSFAHERDTSPILRGAFIITLMGGQTGAPNPDALKVPLPEGTYATNREAVTALTSVAPDCVACHEKVINPPGFVLESYSAVGSIQTKDPEYGGDIDTKVDTVAFPGGAKPINNAHELMTEIAAGRLTKEIYARKWVGYATGRDANDYDQCTANAIADKIDGGNYNLASILADITQAESFRLRAAAE